VLFRSYNRVVLGVLLFGLTTWSFFVPSRAFNPIAFFDLEIIAADEAPAILNTPCSSTP